jgi:putative intracellular protease/amidase
MEMLDAGKCVTALCMGVGPLADTGVLKGKRATGYTGNPVVQNKIKEKRGIWVDKPFEEDGLIITGRDPAAAGQFARALLAWLSKAP